MPDPISSASRRDRFWDPYTSDEDDLSTPPDATTDDEASIADEPPIVAAASETHVEVLSSAAPKVSVLRPTPGQLQHLNPEIVRPLQSAFDRLAETNGGRRIDVSAISFIVQDLGGARGHTVRDVVQIDPRELDRPLDKQLYLVGHELTHVLQFEVIGGPGKDADQRWELMEERYAAEARGPGRGSQYDVPPELTFTGLNVLDRRFTLESIGVRVGHECSGRLFEGGVAR
jgi:hypothetical protein